MADEVTPIETSATETTPPAVDAVSETALGGSVSEPVVEETAVPEEAAAEDAAAKPEIPEAYDLKLSEDMAIDPAMVEAATPIFKELGLSNDQANQLMPVAEQFAKSIGDNLNRQIIEQVTAERKAWLDTAKADPEIGGQNWDANLVTAAKALDGLGFTKGSPFRVLLDESGLGNHPEMIRAFVKVGKAISEDSDFPRNGIATTGARTLADTLYPPKS